MTGDDRSAFDDEWLDKASGGNDVVKEYLRKRWTDHLDWLWAEHVAAQVSTTVSPDAGGHDDQ